MLKSEMQHVLPPLGILATFSQGNAEQLKQLQDFVHGAAPLVDRADGVLADYIAALDEVGRAEDVAEAERTAFSRNWQKQRIYLRQMQQAMFDMRALVVTINAVIHYAQSANSPVAAPQEPSEQQSVELRILIGRGRREFNEAQDRLNRLAETFGQAQSVADSLPNTLEPSKERLYIVLEATERADGLALPTANVAIPQPITSVNEVPGCSIARPAFDFEGGTSLLQLHLSDSGGVSSIELERTSGSAELDESALKCVPGMRFRPATQNGQPVASLIRFPLKWSSSWDSPRQKTCEEFKPKTDLPTDRPREAKQKAPAAIICSCWEESGRLNGPRIIESSGNPRLDTGALKLAESSGFGKPRPPGHPGCDAYRTQFDIHR
jgi:protein TonB